MQSSSGIHSAKSSTAFWQKIRKPILSIFIVYNILGLALLLSPQNVLRQSFLPSFLPYLYATGLFQGRGVFVPRPHTYEIKFTAQINFTDGSSASWNCVNMEDLNVLERFQKEKYRKWARQNMDTNTPLKWWPETAIYLARIHHTKSKVPAEVFLIRHRTDTPPPESKQPAVSTHEIFYRQKISAEDLD